MTLNARHLFTYDRFVVDRDALEIRDAAGAHVPVGPQGVRLFILLFDHLDQVVTRGDIYEALWPDSEADVNRGLNTLVRQLRIGLGDTAAEPRYIRTYQARGYRLLPISHSLADPSEFASADSPVVTPAAEPAQPVASGALAFARRWSRRARVPLLATAGLTIAISIAHARGETTDAVTVTIVGMPAGQHAEWRLALEREAALRGVRPQVRFASGEAPTIFVTCEVERDTVWSASLDGVQPAARDSMVSEALAASRSNPDLGRALPVAAPLSPAQGETLARARHLLRRPDVTDRRRAASLMQRAFDDGAHQPGLRAEFAEALFHAGLLDSAYRQARESVIEEPGVAAGWFMAGVTAHLAHWDWAQAERLIERAVRLDPRVARFHSGLAFVRATAGDRDGARIALSNAISTGAEDALTTADIGHVYALIGEHARAAMYCGQSLELMDLPATRGCAANAHLALGDTTAALRVLGGFPVRDVARWRSAASSRALDAAERSDRGWFAAAQALASAHRPQEALVALDRAIERKEPWAVSALSSPSLEPLRTDPRWNEVVQPLVDRSAGARRQLRAIGRTKDSVRPPRPAGRVSAMSQPTDYALTLR